MDCRRIASTSAMESVLRSPLSTSAPPLTRASTSTSVPRPSLLPQQQQPRCRRRLYDDRRRDECNNNVSMANTTTSMNTTTSLVDELEQLRTDNFQLRLRVYNAERRLDRLSAAETADRGRKNKRNGNGSDDDDDDDSDMDSSIGSTGSGCSGSGSFSTDDEADTDNRKAAATAKATAEAAVRTIHDLLTVNRRLLALLAATVSAKAVTVTADDKRRWKRLRNHIEHCADDWLVNEEEEEDKRQNDESSDASSTDSETCKTETRVSKKRAPRRNIGRTFSPPPPTPPPPRSEEHRTTVDDDSPGSELARLRARCRRLERSLQQLVNTELWARNRQIGKLEQQRYVTQVADAAQRDRRSTAAIAIPQSRPTVAPVTSSPPTKGILVIRSPETSVSKGSATVATTIKTPPPVLPDYSEVNFFFSCDEEDDQQESETNTSTSSTEDETESDEDEAKDEPVRLTDKVPAVATAGNALLRTATAVGATSTPLVRSRKRRRHHHRQSEQCRGLQAETAKTKTLPSSLSSSSTDSASVAGADLNGVPTTTSPTTTSSRRRRRRTISGGSRRRRCSRSRPTCNRCSKCDHRAAGDAGARSQTATASVADAQVQCSSDEAAENVHEVGRNCKDDQLLLLRRELEARRRENCRLYEMLLRLQGEKKSVGDEITKVSSPDLDVSTSPDLDSSAAVDSNSDRGGSPEPYGRAAQAVRSRIADLLPPLLSMRSSADPVAGSTTAASAAVDGGQPRTSCRPQVSNEFQQQQQQLRLLARLRERIVAYERQELLGGDGNVPAVQSAAAPGEDQENAAVRRMDRAALVNVALPRAVDRLRRALVPLLTQKSRENVTLSGSEPLTKLRTTADDDDDDDDCVER